MNQNSLSPPTFPESWASDWGEDRYGLWMSFTIKGVRQKFRWLEPGSFMMGSPGDEPERERVWSGKETPHNVILSKGFWLADSTVTQELWQLVMGKNHSKFKGRHRPVESVSWDDAREFIDQLNELVTGLSVCLPTEAQWEYGCRAGTITPFSFGDNITPNQVNYNGNYPYNYGTKGEYREQTVDVKTLPCNAWGLYEMHGNVWEWCKDWFQEDLGADSVTDPKGPEKGEDRVVRGGSWDGDGGDDRSAFRFWFHPGFSDVNIGFRLARSH